MPKVKVISDPWSQQQDYLKTGFNQADQLMRSQWNTPWYTGSLYAPITSPTQNAVDAMTAYSGGQGAGLTAGMSGALSRTLGAGPMAQYMTGQAYNRAAMDPTAGILASAGQYANNPYMDSMVDAASRDVMRNLNENLLPGARDAQIATGNMGSSRGGIAQGILQRGAAENIGDISATLRGNAFNTGLGTAAGLYGTGLSGMLGAAGTGSGIYGQSLAGVPSAISATGANLGLGLAAGDILQQNQQGQLNEAYQQWLGNDQRKQQLLNNYWGIVGSNNWGGTQTQQQPGASFLDQLSQGMGIAGLGTGILGSLGLFGGSGGTATAGSGSGMASGGALSSMLPMLLMAGAAA
jgi:hypothetical protein